MSMNSTTIIDYIVSLSFPTHVALLKHQLPHLILHIRLLELESVQETQGIKVIGRKWEFQCTDTIIAHHLAYNGSALLYMVII